ncbi:tape measure protein [Dyadobacter chenwenxiniae]|uniref:Tape measure protein n=1 Tax=Dyadobacter chenwenxiniae TaxID=2906456 RepID=A0A9X1TCI3_9BACT|nr:tape measure protein [Dyadobacter chenwenxiniae]MCF0060117.1 tape measure protein [Dyadobacter chenwenxiniae]UON85855.1 tape measure protein [Dyadobacter chenwenxiniae]
MAETVGGANIRITGSSTGFITALSQARQEAALFVREVNSNVSSAYRAADAQQKVFRNGLTRLGTELKSIGSQLSVFGSLPALFAAGTAYKTFADLEKLEIGLKGYGESLKTVRELAKLPNVSIQGAAQSLLQLRAVGVESQFAQRSITAFANALTAAGKSSIDLNPALTNVVQMLSTGIVSAVDVKELANRIPQARRALIEAFGTASGEELTKLGVDKVVEGLIKELEKIPPVAGGAGMALEKLGDDAKFGLASIGESLDKAFGVTKAINEVSEMIGGLTEKFQSLDPKTQKAILGFAGMATVIPVLITAIGGAISITAMFAAGIGVATGTVFAIAAAVAIAGTAIIANWDDIKTSVGDTSIWKTMADVAGSSLSALVELFKVAANLITGDWGNMGISLVNVLSHIGNAGVKILGGLLKFLPSAMGLITGIDTSFLTKGIDKLVNALTIQIPKGAGFSTAAIDNLRKKFNDLVGGGIGNIPKVDPKAPKGRGVAVPKDLTELGFINWQIDLASKVYKDQKAIKDATNTYKELVGVVKALNIERLKLSNSTGSTIGNSTYAGREVAKNRLGAIGDLRTGQTLDSLNRSIAKNKFGDTIRESASLELSDFVGGNSLSDIRQYFNQITQIAGESNNEYAKRVYSIVDGTKDLSSGLTSALKTAAADVAYGFGEMLGNLMSGAGGIEQFGKRVMGSLANMMKEMGKSLIATGTAGIALKVFAKNPALALVAGIGLVALGTAAQNKLNSQAESGLTKFANSGMAYRKMVAVVGDNPNARHDPEIIAPKSMVEKTIQKSISNMGGHGNGNGFIAEARISGQDLLILISQAQDRNKNIRGF